LYAGALKVCAMHLKHISEARQNQLRVILGNEGICDLFTEGAALGE